MKKMFFIMSLIVLVSIIYLIVMNVHSCVDLNYLYENIVKIVEPNGIKTLNLAFYSLVILVAGVFVGAGTLYMFLSESKARVKAYERELEKVSVSGQNNASKVDVLEAKIKTLENALDSVLSEKSNLEKQVSSLQAEIDKNS